MNRGFRANSIEASEYAASRQAKPGWPENGRTKTMNLRTTAIALGVAATLATGAAFAQSEYDQGQGYSQQGPGQQAYHQHRHKHGIVALLKEEMNAGRLSKKEGALLMEKIKQLHAEKRAEREARRGEGAPSDMQPR